LLVVSDASFFFFMQVEIIAGLVCNNPTIEADLNTNADVEAVASITLQVFALCKPSLI